MLFSISDAMRERSAEISEDTLFVGTTLERPSTARAEALPYCSLVAGSTELGTFKRSDMSYR